MITIRFRQKPMRPGVNGLSAAGLNWVSAINTLPVTIGAMTWPAGSLVCNTVKNVVCDDCGFVHREFTFESIAALEMERGQPIDRTLYLHHDYNVLKAWAALHCPDARNMN